jgi:hypothetical protein
MGIIIAVILALNPMFSLPSYHANQKRPNGKQLYFARLQYGGNKEAFDRDLNSLVEKMTTYEIDAMVTEYKEFRSKVNLVKDIAILLTLSVIALYPSFF